MKNTAAQSLGRLGGSKTSESKAATARENGTKGGRPAYTRCALFKGEADVDQGKNVWWLTTLDQDLLPSVGGFPTAAAARAEAASRGWRPIRKQEWDS